MKIVYISSSSIPSRTANSIHVMKMCQAFADNGHEVVLLAPNIYKEYENGVDDIYEYYGVRKNFEIKKLWWLYIKGSSFIYSLAIFFYFLFNKKPDIVYGRFLHGCYVATLFKNKVIFESHAPIYENKNYELKLFKKFIKSKYFQKLVVISQALKNMYLENGYLSDDKIQVAHDGADEVKDFESKAELLGDKNSLKVGYVGHLYKGRGIELIIECAKNVKDMSFHIVGGTDEDIAYWEKQIEKLNIDNIYFYGFVSPKEAVLYRNTFDIVLAPYAKKVSVAGNTGDTSRFMSPLKIFEYMAHKKAIVCSDIPVLREVLNEENSILVDPENSEEWIKAIDDLKDIAIREKLSQKAYDKFIQEYRWIKRAEVIIYEK